MKIIIPARLRSGRVPNKPLQKIGDKTVIEWVYDGVAEAAEQLGADVLVAVDSDAVCEVLDKRGITRLDTRAIDPVRQPANGTERVALVAQFLDLPPSEPIINVQGDNWAVVSHAVVQLAEKMREHTLVNVNARARTLYCLCEDLLDGDRNDPSVVKVVTSSTDYALFFTRAYVTNAKKHCGIYGYHGSFLAQYLMGMPHQMLEENERLEQMRVLENGGHVYCPHLEGMSTAGSAINTLGDLWQARTLVADLDVEA